MVRPVCQPPVGNSLLLEGKPDIVNRFDRAVGPADLSFLPELVAELIRALLGAVLGPNPLNPRLCDRRQFLRFGDAVMVSIAPQQQATEDRIAGIDSTLCITCAPRRSLGKLQRFEAIQRGDVRSIAVDGCVV